MSDINDKIPVMAHLVLGYPTLAESLRTADQYVQAGVQILELQIPFSHPTADGPVITLACQEAVEKQGVTVAQSIDAIRSIRERYPDQEIMVMSYINRVFSFGIDRFCQAMIALGIRHLIVPDLPVDSPLAAAFDAFPAVQLVPVLAANVTDSRLDTLLQRRFEFYYLMSDFKITGSGFSLHPRLKAIIAHIRRADTNAKIGIGFGISTPEQVRLVAQAVDVAIIGSILIKAQKIGYLEAFLGDIQAVFTEKV